MKAFEILHNGERQAICGAENLKQLSTMLTLSWPEAKAENGSADFEYFIDVQGLSKTKENEEEVLKWVRTKLNLVSEITIRIVEVEAADLPKDKQTIKSRREEFERYNFEAAKHTYLKYRDKYEQT